MDRYEADEHGQIMQEHEASNFDGVYLAQGALKPTSRPKMFYLLLKQIQTGFFVTDWNLKLIF